MLSILIVVEGLGIVQHALMERQLDFKRLALRSNLSVLLGGAAGIPLALAGAGVWALVAQQLVLETTLLVMMWLLNPWRPGLRFSRPHARELIGFSVSVFAANLAGFVNRRADALLMGIFWGPVAVGLYRLADRLVDVVLEVTMRPVGLVSLPVLSRLQDDPEKLREAVAKCLRTTLLFAVPVLLVVLAASDEIVAVLGTDWEQAGIALQFLCLVGIGKAIAFFTGPVLFAANRPRFRAIMLWVLAAVSTAHRGARRRAHSRLVRRRSGAGDVLVAGCSLPLRPRAREPRDRVAHDGLAAPDAAARGAGSRALRSRCDRGRRRAARRRRRRAAALAGAGRRRRRGRRDRRRGAARARARPPRAAACAWSGRFAAARPSRSCEEALLDRSSRSIRRPSRSTRLPAAADAPLSVSALKLVSPLCGASSCASAA